MSYIKDLTGKRFGKLVVLKYSHSFENIAYWATMCDCGKEGIKKAKYLLNGDTKSCGCILSKNGRAKTRPYRIWQSMMTRCYNKNSQSYQRYGGRGVTVCERWHDSTTFIEDTKEGYADNLTLDRYPNRHGNYEPGNVRWADGYQQAKNKDRTKLYLFRGEMLCVPEIAKLTGVTAYSIYGKLAYGYSIEEATKPKETPIARRNSTIVILNGHKKTVTELSRETGIKYDKLHHRIVNLKLSAEEAINYERYPEKSLICQ